MFYIVLFVGRLFVCAWFSVTRIGSGVCQLSYNRLYSACNLFLNLLTQLYIQY
jgi:hypothetical protein